MAAFTQSFKKKLLREGYIQCCEMCGTNALRLKNRGLQVAHIISDKKRKWENISNAMVLCHQCAEIFDRYLKPKIWNAFSEAKRAIGRRYRAPDNWKDGEGRQANKDFLRYPNERPFFIKKNKQPLGPFTKEELKNELKQKTVTRNDLAWQEGMPEWLPLRRIYPPQSRTQKGERRPGKEEGNISAKLKLSRNT